MKLINHIIFADVDTETKLMINSLNGTMDEINIPIFDTLTAWQTLEPVFNNYPADLTKWQHER